MIRNRITSILILLGLTVAAGESVRAESVALNGVFGVDLDTSALAGTTETLAFSLAQGDGVFENTVTLSDFNFGGGQPLGTPSYSGSGITGDLSSTVTLEDTDFLE